MKIRNYDTVDFERLISLLKDCRLFYDFIHGMSGASAAIWRKGFNPRNPSSLSSPVNIVPT